MTTTIRAIYQNGVLRPTQPLPLAEGETVEITLAWPKEPVPPLTEEEAVERIRSAKSLVEVFALAAEAPEDENYDLLKALDENRKFSGDPRPLFPPELKGISW